MKSHIIQAIRLTIVTIVLFSGIYTLILYGIGQAAPNQGKGEVVEYKGKKYYANIGQEFNQDQYFWSRPSAVDYNAAGSAGSNKGPSNPEYLEAVKARIDTFLVHNPGITKSQIPVDLVTASGSGLDPNISLQAAKVQIKRIAKIRQVPENKLAALVDQHTEKPLLGLFGPEKINVLKLNIALDELK
ncbi:K(+)-transporting ATPase subunit C [Olivibacter sp. CPCC 100613]|uniref:K(+)-transporting ATPase subunit C n=1 Tax=Olivibacter sp. CPCC 100613 TaxID=3079931 RepID=UPI002FFCD718